MAKFTLLSGRLETIIGTSLRNPTNAAFLVEDGFFFVGVRVFASIPQPSQLILAFVPLVLFTPSQPTSSPVSHFVPTLHTVVVPVARSRSSRCCGRGTHRRRAGDSLESHSRSRC